MPLAELETWIGGGRLHEGPVVAGLYLARTFLSKVDTGTLHIMANRYFIGYSSVDGADFAFVPLRRLVDSRTV